MESVSVSARVGVGVTSTSGGGGVEGKGGGVGGCAGRQRDSRTRAEPEAGVCKLAGTHGCTTAAAAAALLPRRRRRCRRALSPCCRPLARPPRAPPAANPLPHTHPHFLLEVVGAHVDRLLDGEHPRPLPQLAQHELHLVVAPSPLAQLIRAARRGGGGRAGRGREYSPHSARSLPRRCTAHPQLWNTPRRRGGAAECSGGGHPMSC